LSENDFSSEEIANMPVGFHGNVNMLVDDKRHTWFIQSLVQATESLPIVTIVLSDLDQYLDDNAWFSESNEPTVRAVIQHYQRIDSADLNFPIILSPEFGVLDGLHRIAKANILRHPTIKAVILDKLPEPDYIDVCNEIII